MSIQAVKGVEVGDGFDVAGRRGSVARRPDLVGCRRQDVPTGEHPGGRN